MPTSRGRFDLASRISQDSNGWAWGMRGTHSGHNLFSARLDLAAGTAYFAYAVGHPEPGQGEEHVHAFCSQAFKLN